MKNQRNLPKKRKGRSVRKAVKRRSERGNEGSARSARRSPKDTIPSRSPRPRSRRRVHRGANQPVHPASRTKDWTSRASSRPQSQWQVTPSSQDSCHHHRLLGGPDHRATLHLIAKAAAEDKEPTGRGDLGPEAQPRGREARKEPNTAREGSIVKQVDTTRSNGTQSQAKSKRPCQASSQPSSTQEGGGTSASLASTRRSPSRRGSSWASGAMVERGRGALDHVPVEEFGKGMSVVFPEITYFMAPASLAGVIKGVTIESGAVHLLVSQHRQPRRHFFASIRAGRTLFFVVIGAPRSALGKSWRTTWCTCRRPAS